MSRVDMDIVAAAERFSALRIPFICMYAALQAAQKIILLFGRTRALSVKSTVATQK